MYFNVDHHERSSQDATITTASLVIATIAMTSSRTATVPMATRRTHIASTMAKECTRHRVKHPLLSPARGLVNFEIKANCTHLQHGQAQKRLEEMFESAKEAS